MTWTSVKRIWALIFEHLSSSPGPFWRVAPDTVLKIIHTYDGSERVLSHRNCLYQFSKADTLHLGEEDYVYLWNTSTAVICISMAISQCLEPIQAGLGASWICLTALKRQPSTPGYPQTGLTPLKCRGNYFLNISAVPFSSYTEMSTWVDGRRRLTNPSINQGRPQHFPKVRFDDSLPLVLIHHPCRHQYLQREIENRRQGLAS